MILPSERWSVARHKWRHAQSLGLHAAYTYDHLSWRSFRDRPWFTMIPTLTAAALETSTLRLGPLVTSPNFRHPLLLAKDLIALDDIAQGRLIVGVGSGGTGYDATVLGHASWGAGERHRRFEEFARFLDTLLREPQSTLDGEFYPVVDSRQMPGPVQVPRPPLVLSALGPKSLALTAEIADGWVSFGTSKGEATESTFSIISSQVNSLEAQLAQRGRASASLTRILLAFEGDENPTASLEAFTDWAGRYRALGFDEVVVLWPEPDSPFDYSMDVFESIATEGSARLAAWG